MDAKGNYSDMAYEMYEMAERDADLAHEFEKSKERCAEYKDNWEWVNINEVVERLAPGSKPVMEHGKIIFYNKEHTVAIVADANGGYLRIQDLTKKTRKPQYLDINGEDAHNITENGKTRGRSHSEYLKHTHYRILKREDMR